MPLSFEQRSWVDQKSQYPGRRLINDGTTQKTVMIERDEGTVRTEGDEFNAAAMNDLETRITAAFDELVASIGSVQGMFDLYYPPGKILMAMKDLQLENASKAQALFGCKSTWVRLADDVVLLPVASGGDGRVVNNPTEVTPTMSGSASITSAPYVDKTSLRPDQCPPHTHPYEDKQTEHTPQSVDFNYRHDGTQAGCREPGLIGNDGNLVGGDVTTGMTGITRGGEYSHTHTCNYSAQFTASPANKINTVQRSLKVYVWQRTG